MATSDQPSSHIYHPNCQNELEFCYPSVLPPLQHTLVKSSSDPQPQASFQAGNHLDR